MNSFEAYKLYLALKQHFNSDYDFFKYNGKVNASEDAFEERKDKYFFRKLANSAAPKDYLVANFLNNPKLYIRELNTKNAASIWQAWDDRQKNLLKYAKDEIDSLDGGIDDWLKVKDGQHPYLFKAYLKNLVDTHTLLMIDSVCEFLPYWDQKIRDPIVWKTKYNMLEKYRPFMMISDENARELRSFILKKTQENLRN